MEFTLEGEREKAILVGMETTAANPEETAYSLEELARLADTAGADVLLQVTQRRGRPDAATFLGRGKAEELAESWLSLTVNFLPHRHATWKTLQVYESLTEPS